MLSRSWRKKGSEFRVGGMGGVVHSFTGTTEEAQDYVGILYRGQSDHKIDQFLVDEHGISYQVIG